jgi:hypothetical protein
LGELDAQRLLGPDVSVSNGVRDQLGEQQEDVFADLCGQRAVACDQRSPGRDGSVAAAVDTEGDHRPLLGSTSRTSGRGRPAAAWRHTSCAMWGEDSNMLGS